tara:strand:- start:337 stop:783 length:447 start_codon:yes stop_codon:yes gene_type:complete
MESLGHYGAGYTCCDKHGAYGNYGEYGGIVITTGLIIAALGTASAGAGVASSAIDYKAGRDAVDAMAAQGKTALAMQRKARSGTALERAQAAQAISGQAINTLALMGQSGQAMAQKQFEAQERGKLIGLGVIGLVGMVALMAAMKGKK